MEEVDRWPTEEELREETPEAVPGTSLALADGGTVSIEELVSLCAIDTDLFAHTFFPKTFRQESAPFHSQMWKLLDAFEQFTLLASFRGSSKTTRLRTMTAKRIAYGLSHTILYIGATEDHALRSVQWIRKQVETNNLYKTVFGLRPGRKWQEHEAEVHRTTEDDYVWLVGYGITSKGLRGVNFDDYRPDLIILDDCITDENAATPEQRDKVRNLLFGTIIPALAPRTEAPRAQVIMSQTPIHPEDASALALQDKMWKCYTFPCWTPETLKLPPDQQISSWPQRYTTEFLRKLKQSFTRQNKLSVFLREYEIRLVQAEKTAFLQEWWKEWDADIPPGFTVVTIDPVPPPSPKQIANNMLTKDNEVVMALRRVKGKFLICEYRANKGHEPNWTTATAMELSMRWGAARITVEATGYQRVLEFLLRQAMARKGIYWAIRMVDSTENKYIRIVNSLSGPWSHGLILARPGMDALRGEFLQYPGSTHDDHLDALSIGVLDIGGAFQEEGSNASSVYELDESEYEDMDFRRRAP